MSSKFIEQIKINRMKSLKYMMKRNNYPFTCKKNVYHLSVPWCNQVGTLESKYILFPKNWNETR